MTLRRKAAIVGIAHLPFSKNIGTPERTNAMRVTLQALDDAGLRPDDVDGMVGVWLQPAQRFEGELAIADVSDPVSMAL